MTLRSLLYDWMVIDASPRVAPRDAASPDDIEHLVALRSRARALAEAPCVAALRPVHTNIVIFDLAEGWTAAAFLDLLRERDVRASAFGPRTVRFVTHLDVDRPMIERVCKALASIPGRPG